MTQIQIYDTTLRDGTQSEGFTLSSNDNVRIAQKLDELGVAFIEGGWPGSNPKDVEFFERARDMQWKNALIAAFGSTCRVKGGAEDDANIKALIDSNTPVCTIFGKTWTLHVTDVLLTTLEDNLRIIEQFVAYLKANGKRVIYDAEQIIGVINSTLLGRPSGDETIRTIIGSNLEGEAGDASLQGYLNRIQKAFLVAHEAFKQAIVGKLDEVLAELDPDRIARSSERGLKFGPLRKADCSRSTWRNSRRAGHTISPDACSPI